MSAMKSSTYTTHTDTTFTLPLLGNSCLMTPRMFPFSQRLFTLDVKCFPFCRFSQHVLVNF